MQDILLDGALRIRQVFKYTRPPETFDLGIAAADLPPGMNPKTPWKPASVLVPLVMHPGNTAVLLTRRTESLLDHAGQVSFPGGSRERQDTNTVETALRETEEEIGLARRFVETVGFLDGYLTITGFAVTPVIGLVQPDFHLKPDPLEVAEVFEIPLGFLRNPANRQRRSRLVGEHEVGYYQFEHGGHVIWGATAGMLVNFIDKLGHET